MHTTRFTFTIIYCLTLLFSTLFSSCVNKKKDFSTLETVKTNLDSDLDFSNFSSLNESNRKTIDIINQISLLKTTAPQLNLILKIKQDYFKNDSELKRLSKKNLIVLPKPFYQLKFSKDSLKKENATEYLIVQLVTEINKQLKILETLQSTTINIDFKTFAEQSKLQTEQNYKELIVSFNQY